MKTIAIDFNDLTYRETGIHAESVVLREAPLEAETGVTYSLQAVKKNVAGRETLYLTLSNAYGMPVQDLQVKLMGTILAVTGATSQHAVVIEDIDQGKLHDVELLAPSQSIHVKLQIALEQPLPSKSPKPGRRKEAPQAEHTRKKRE